MHDPRGHEEEEQQEQPLVIYAAKSRDHTQGFLHTGDGNGTPIVETRDERKRRRGF